MPSGDAQRIWFPAMSVWLRSEWHEGVSMPAPISLRHELDGMLQRIRTDRPSRQRSSLAAGVGEWDLQQKPTLGCVP